MERLSHAENSDDESTNDSLTLKLLVVLRLEAETSVGKAKTSVGSRANEKYAKQN
jgi:hypothetical protein